MEQKIIQEDLKYFLETSCYRPSFLAQQET